MLIVLLAALFTILALETHVFAQETGSRRHGPLTEASTACEGKSAGDTVTGICEPAEDLQAEDPDTLAGPADDYVSGLVWREVSGNSRYGLADATAYPGLLPLNSGDDSRRYSLKESISTGEFESGAPFIDLTRYRFVSFKEEQYRCINYDDFGTYQDGIDAEYSTNIFTIDTHGNISGVTGLILGMLH